MHKLRENHGGREEARATDPARRIIIRLATETHRALRISVAEEDTSIQKWLEALIEREPGGVRATFSRMGSKRS